MDDVRHAYHLSAIWLIQGIQSSGTSSSGGKRSYGEFLKSEEGLATNILASRLERLVELIRKDNRAISLEAREKVKRGEAIVKEYLG